MVLVYTTLPFPMGSKLSVSSSSITPKNPWVFAFFWFIPMGSTATDRRGEGKVPFPRTRRNISISQASCLSTSPSIPRCATRWPSAYWIEWKTMPGWQRGGGGGSWWLKGRKEKSSERGKKTSRLFRVLMFLFVLGCLWLFVGFGSLS